MMSQEANQIKVGSRDLIFFLLHCKSFLNRRLVVLTAESKSEDLETEYRFQTIYTVAILVTYFQILSRN